MVKVIASYSFEDSAPVFVDENVVTPRQAIENAGMSGYSGQWRADGRQLTDENMDAPLSALGYGASRPSVHLTNVPKRDNA